MLLGYSLLSRFLLISLRLGLGSENIELILALV